MAAPYNPPVKGENFIFFISLADFSSLGKMRENPTISSGDFKISKNGGSFSNLSTLPNVTPSGSVQVKITLSAVEMNADNIFIRCHDQSGTLQWADLSISIVTVAA